MKSEHELNNKIIARWHVVCCSQGMQNSEEAHDQPVFFDRRITDECCTVETPKQISAWVESLNRLEMLHVTKSWSISSLRNQTAARKNCAFFL